MSENRNLRIRYNEELDKIIQGEDIIRFIKSHRIRWFCHVERMEQEEMPKRMLYGKLYKQEKEEDQRIDGWMGWLRLKEDGCYQMEAKS
jgi:hypothetical protein